MERAKALELESCSSGFRLSSLQPRLTAGGKARPSWGGWFSPELSHAFGFHNVCAWKGCTEGKKERSRFDRKRREQPASPPQCGIQMLQGEGGGETAVRGREEVPWSVEDVAEQRKGGQPIPGL